MSSTKSRERSSTKNSTARTNRLVAALQSPEGPRATPSRAPERPSERCRARGASKDLLSPLRSDVRPAEPASLESQKTWGASAEGLETSTTTATSPQPGLSGLRGAYSPFGLCGSITRNRARRFFGVCTARGGFVSTRHMHRAPIKTWYTH